MAALIDRRTIAANLAATAAARWGALAQRGVVPGLAVILVGDDPASRIYVDRKLREAAKTGVRSFEHRLPAATSAGDLLALIDALNANPEVHGILVQLPLPPQIDPTRILDAIDPAKDVDRFHPVNVGRLSTVTGGLVPRARRSAANGRARIVGDTMQAELDHARASTPVRGGVGPMTIACLLENTVRAAEIACTA